MITVESFLGVKSGPHVKLAWGKEEGVLTPSEARMHALRILEAADAAESDDFIFHFLTTQASLEPEAAARILQEFRSYRRIYNTHDEEGDI